MESIIFKSSEELKSLAKKTLETERFKVAYQDKLTGRKCFFFVKDEGIYLMNSYKSDPKNDDWYVCYGEGFDPNENPDYWEDSRRAVGGDDFAENLYLPSGQLKALADGWDLELRIDKTTIETRCFR
jgi:hypothetical protein